MGTRLCFQKQESFLKPLVDQNAKEGKDKKVVFEAIFSKTNSKPKWFFRKDVSNFEKLFQTYFFPETYIFLILIFLCYRNYSQALNTR